MIGKLDPTRKEVTIVGAGVAGLLAAHSLDRTGWEVTLIEAANRAGGLIRTEQTPWGIAESAAHSLLATPAVQALFSELGVELLPVHKESRARYILRNGKLRKFPLSPTEALGAFFRAYFALADRSKAPEERNLEEWARNFLGEPALRYLLTPFTRGIYGVAPKELSVSAAFPGLIVPQGHSLLSSWISKKRSQEGTPRSRGKMAAPAGGMGSFVNALSERLQSRLGSRFRVGERLEKIRDAQNLILAVPAYEAGRLLAGESPELSEKLLQTVYTPLVAVTAFVEQRELPRKIQGVGVLFPEGEGREALGILFNSSAFAGRVRDESELASFTLMFGGGSCPEFVHHSNDSIVRSVTNELREVLGARSVAHVEIRKWEKAIPCYSSSLAETWGLARETWCKDPGHVLFGNYSGQVSLRGMIETVTQSEFHHGESSFDFK